MSNEVCGDNRFEIIEKAKQDLLESTNIQTSEDEMQVIDNFLFRCWQMGWLEKYEQPKTDCSECSRRKFYQQGYQDGLNADKWIPCEEMLPNEEDELYLTYKYSDIIQVLPWTKKGFNTHKYEDGSYCSSYAIKNIIAWQPLPQPYKKEGAE